jgi:hypothetical protein
MCVLVPAGLHRLGAGPDEIAALARPGSSVFHTGDATVAVSVDQSIVKAGDKVAITLSATSEREQKVKVALIVHEERGSEGGRVSLPPVEVVHKMITLKATPEGGPNKQVSVKLRGYVGMEMEGMSAFGNYTILVLEPAAANNLRKQRREFKRDYDGTNDPMDVDASAYWEAVHPDINDDDDFNVVARVEVNTYKSSKKLRIDIPESAEEGNTFVANVVISNPTRKAMKGATVYLSRPYLDAASDFEDGDVTFMNPADGNKVDVPARGEVIVPIEVEVGVSGTVGMFATVYDADGYTYATAIEGIAVTPMDTANMEAVAENPWLDDFIDAATEPVQVRIAEVH